LFQKNEDPPYIHIDAVNSIREQCFSTPLSNPDNKVPLNLAYHRANIRRLRPVVLSRYLLRRCPFVVDPITGSCERVLRNKRTVKMSYMELVYVARGLTRDYSPRLINHDISSAFSFFRFHSLRGFVVREIRPERLSDSRFIGRDSP